MPQVLNTYDAQGKPALQNHPEAPLVFLPGSTVFKPEPFTLRGAGQEIP